jgi:hypothetical protein
MQFFLLRQFVLLSNFNQFVARNYLKKDFKNDIEALEIIPSFNYKYESNLKYLKPKK